MWASQAPAAPSPWKTWMNRTPALGQPPGRQELLAERPGHVVVEAVEPSRGLVLVVETQDFGNGRLHAEGQLVRLDPGAQLGIVGVLQGREPVQPAQEVGLDRPLGSARPGLPGGRRAGGRSGRP